VVTAITAGGAEVIAPDCGIVLDNPDDDETLARVMLELAADRPRVAALGAAARARALTLTSDEMGRRYVELYRSLAFDDARRAAPSAATSR
jgi:glycosyltransferase involved in cell wall biosynthesis